MRNGVSKRHAGIELFRIVSMLMVIVLHILAHGGVLLNVRIDSMGGFSIWYMDAMAICAVNCFALISGYVTYRFI